MLSVTATLALALAAAPFIHAVTPERRAAGPQCHDFNIPIHASTAHNKHIYSPTDDLSTVAGVTSFLSSTAGIFSQDFADIPASGTFPISARYCAPTTSNAKRNKHLQVLLHGIPYNKNWWSGLAPSGLPAADNPHRYDWIAYATAQGYPVLAIDQLGGGNSTVHPDPILVVQQPLEAQIVHGLAQKLRAASILQVPVKPEKLIFATHSYASVLSNYLAARHPADFDALVLTGYTYTIANAVPGVLLDQLEPAVLYSPATYGNLAPGYLTFGNQLGKRLSYYAEDGSFNNDVQAFDFAHQGTTTIGEFATFFAGLQKAAAYKGDVLVVTGEEDALFCGDGTRLTGAPSCGQGASSIPAQSRQFWPNAKTYRYIIPPAASHAINLHYSSYNMFVHVHQQLAALGY